jgi:predicted esterase
MTEHSISVQRTARYCLLGTPSENTRDIWLVCHGYGQLARFFVRNFTTIANDTRLIVAPEGLSRFYLYGNSGRMGASWMTREDRQHEITDYITYLNQLYDNLAGQAPAAVQLTVLGFSQGVATACRWVDAGHASPQRLIIWAGMLPPEIDLEQWRKRFPGLQIDLVIGDSDAYARPEKVAQLKGLLRDSGIPYAIHTFDGGHVIDAGILARLAV